MISDGKSLVMKITLQCLHLNIRQISTEMVIYAYSEALVEKGDHIRLKDVRFSYIFKNWKG